MLVNDLSGVARALKEDELFAGMIRDEFAPKSVDTAPEEPTAAVQAADLDADLVKETESPEPEN
jgi:hypothetical protein